MNQMVFRVPPELDRDFQRLQQRFLLIGVAALILCAIGAIFNPDQFFRSYLVAFLFWTGVALGSMAIIMLHHLSGGAWGLLIRRILESATRTIPLLMVMFLPLVFGMRYLYTWTHADVVAHDKILQHKSVYLNVPFFLGRAAIYFAIWIIVSYFLNKWSLDQDRTGDPPISTRLQLLSGPGLVLYGATVTLAVVDWVMSLDPHWFSTIFGLIFIGAQGLSAMCFVIAVVVILSSREPLLTVIKPSHLHDLGKLLFAFLMLWAYFNFSQFLIIWSGNLPEEIPWYLKRFTGPWKWIGFGLVILHFALPFVLLLSRDLKRSGRLLTRVAMLVVACRIVELFWQVAPTGENGAFPVPWMYVVAPIGVGGIWLAVFLWQLKQRPLLPIGDPHMKEVLASAGH